MNQRKHSTLDAVEYAHIVLLQSMLLRECDVGVTVSIFFQRWSILILFEITSWYFSLLSLCLSTWQRTGWMAFNYSLGLLVIVSLAGRGKESTNWTGILGLFFEDLYFLVCTLHILSLKTSHLTLSSEGVHPCVAPQPSSNIRYLCFNGNFSQGFFIQLEQIQVLILEPLTCIGVGWSFLYCVHIRKEQGNDKNMIYKLLWLKVTLVIFFFFLRVVVYAGSKTIFCVVCKVSD